MIGYADKPPSHVPWHVVPISNGCLAFGGSLYVVANWLRVREARRTGSYAMPMFAMAFHLSWEIVYSFIAPSKFERTGFTVWVLSNAYMAYEILRVGGPNEWTHAPIIRRNIHSIFAVMVACSCVAHWCFAQWFLDNKIGIEHGKTYDDQGTPSADWAELAYFSAMTCQVYATVACVAQLLIRGSTRGAAPMSWFLHAVGTTVGLLGYFVWRWWFWPEAHEYLLTPVALFMLVSCLVADLVAWPLVYLAVKRVEEQETASTAVGVEKG